MVGLSVAVTASISGCGWWDADDGPSVPARAAESAERLPPRQREAAQALVRLEAAARDRDAEKLCESVYDFSRGQPSPGCERSTARVFPTEDGFAIAIRRVRFRASDEAVGDALTVTVNGEGRLERFPRTTYELVRRDGVWRVHFID